MAIGQKLYSYIEVRDDTPIQKLSLLDQIRVLLHHLSYDEANELKADDVYTQEILTLKANLSDFLYRATLPIRNGQKHEVAVAVSNKFDTVLDEVLNSPMIANFYDVKVCYPKFDYDVALDVLVILRVKES